MTDTMTPPPEPTPPPAPNMPPPGMEQSPTPGLSAEAPPVETPPEASPPMEESMPEQEALEGMASDEGGKAPEPKTEAPTGEDIPLVPDEKKPTGIKGEIKDIADDYVIPISDNALEQWSKALGDKKADAFKTYAEQVACGLYPTLAPQISMGISTRILLDPYVRVAEQVLGPVMSEPDWTDPKWASALQGGQDAKTGRPVPMTLDQWGKFLRSEPSHKFDESPEATSRVQDFLKTMNDQFTGKSSGGA